ncbi:hypothetical protein TNIN_66971 [Trichonephila inaurata madagascariensis]|uniref:Uncharacterized protein n=1 Tax=Trichonephila inaurata madagascariensis TaxID=2747483 RepID=A0A8X6X5L1_9ARAC|nr:hypothetical protein TNIN_66971 [Trichonephila inaurata madagascariensis]
MDENKHVEEEKDFEMRLEAPSTSGVSQDKCLLGLWTQELAEKEEEKDVPLKYLHITRYLLLNSLDESPFCLDPLFFDELEKNEFYGIYVVTNMLAFCIFNNVFKKILEKREEIKSYSKTNSDCDTSDVQFLLSRCAFLCPVPTYSNFVLVVAFLTLVVFMDIDILNCFHTMYISEFCLSVLYRRKFWQIFQSEKNYKELKYLCNGFRKHFNLTHSAMTELRNTSVGENWMNLLNPRKTFY